MGVITQGILGGFSGKVGPVVGGKWKDIDYMRGYVVPSNPNTTGQQTVRTKFSALVNLARLLLSTILQPFWDLYYSDMSGFNAWISENYILVDGSNKLQATSLMAKGNLETLHTNTSTYDTATGETSISWTAGIQSNGASDDTVGIVIYEKTTDRFFFDIGNITRNDGTTLVTIDSGFSATNVIVYIFAYRGTGPALEVSDSVGDVTATP